MVLDACVLLVIFVADKSVEIAKGALLLWIEITFELM